MYQAGQNQHDVGYVGTPEFYPPQVTGNTYCYNIAPLMDDLESPFYLVFVQNPLEGRVSNLQNYCRYMGYKPGRLAVHEL